MLQADRYWPELCAQIGRPDLATDERFSSVPARAANLAACMAELDATFARHTLAQWRDKLAGLSGAWAVSQSATDLLEDPQVLANGYLAEVEYETRTHSLVTGPAQFDGQPPALTRAPAVGEHTDEILLELGTDWDEIVKFKVDGVVN
jgi:crotonobetainyl-CoA:carnitine CoA-transferase CaiB-like acyl-CoA transferase